MLTLQKDHWTCTLCDTIVVPSLHSLSSMHKRRLLIAEMVAEKVAVSSSEGLGSLRPNDQLVPRLHVTVNLMIYYIAQNL